MCISRRPGVRLAVIAALLSVAALAPGGATAASCTGNSHAMALSGGTVSPGSGTTSTDFTFTVVYADNGGCSPDEIVVAIPGVGQFALAHRRGDLQTGATFGRQLNLPVGVWSYRFEATSGSGTGTRTDTLTKVDPAKVRVTAPRPRETPRPPPSTEPTARPDPATPEPTPARPQPTEPPHTPEPTPDGTKPGHDDSTPEPTAVAARPGPGRGGPPDDLDGGLAGSLGSRQEELPRPILALLVSIAGTIVGILLYLFLGARLLVPGPQRRTDRGLAGSAEPSR